MKKVLLVIFLFNSVFNPLKTFGQWAQWNRITFDLGDTLWQHAIYIDTIHYHHNLWQVGKPHKTIFDSALSLPNAIVTDTLNPYPSNDTSVFLITFPGNASGYWADLFSFYYEINIDSSSVTKIEFSSDSGSSWINLHDSIPYGFGYIPLLSTTPGWHYWSISLGGGMDSYFHNDSLKIKFTFISDNGTLGRDGWMMDDFEVIYEREGVPTIENNKLVNIYPNPVATTLTISSTNEITTVAISNLLGQTIYSNDFNADKVQIDVAYLPAGVYQLKINDTEVRKFVKQ
jgi:hypothetical protein